MTLAPMSAQGPAVDVTMASQTATPMSSGPAVGGGTDTASGTGIGLNYASGSGGAPTISNSSFPLKETALIGTERDYAVNTPSGTVPVGSTAVFRVVPPTGETIATVTWSGGTTYQTYFSTRAIDPAPKAMKPTTPTPTNTSQYQFIVDATAKPYTVTANVTYTDGKGGSCVVTFGSERPTTASLTVSQLGIQSYSLTYKPDNVPNMVTIWLNTGIHIQARTTAGPNFGGSFMFMQIITSNYKRYTDASGKVWHIKNDINIPNGENFNGSLHDDGSTVGYPYTYKGQPGYGWYLNPNESRPEPAVPPNPAPSPPEMVDTPAMSVPNTYLEVTEQESFATYLMYNPGQLSWGGVWIALAEVDWSWSKSLIRTPSNPWPTPPDSLQPNPTTTTPSGGAAFPAWVNTANNFNDQINMNPYRPGP